MSVPTYALLLRGSSAMQLTGTFGSPLLTFVQVEPPSVERNTFCPLAQLLHVAHSTAGLVGSIATLLMLAGKLPAILVQFVPPSVVRNIVERVPTTMTSVFEGATARYVARAFVASGAPSEVQFEPRFVER